MSTFNTTNIESTSGGAPSFSQGLNVGGSSITTLITLTEYYSQAEEPSSPANGAVWWDGSVAYQYAGGAWRILSVTAPPPTWYGDTALVAGGIFSGVRTSTIDTFSISTPANATVYPNQLSENKDGVAACSNGTRGVFGGGFTTTFSNVIEYVTISSSSSVQDFGDLTVARYLGTGFSDGIYGVFAAGYTNTIDYITIESTGNAIDFGDLAQSKQAVAGAANTTYGLIAGGYVPSDFQSTNRIDYITIATPSNATDFGDLTGAVSGLGGCSSLTRALFAGGNSSNVIEYVSINTPSNATDFGDLTVARSDLAAVSNSIIGVFAGGRNPTGVDVIDYVTIATPSNATDFGNLSAAENNAGGCSGD